MRRIALAEIVHAQSAGGLGEALDATVPAAAKKTKSRRIPFLEIDIPPDIAQTAVAELEETNQKQSRVLRCVLEYGGPIRVLQVRQQTGTSDSPWKTLVKNGLLKRTYREDAGEPLEPSVEENAVRHDLNEAAARRD